MKNNIFSLCALCLLCALCGLSCHTNEKVSNHALLTFDDASVDEWIAQKELFDRYNVKATFFISHLHKLSKEQVEMLKQLETAGHEIGCHGMNHIKATEENQYQYIETEIEPALQLLADYGFTVTSFAYPFGSSTPYLDSALANYFTFIRKAIYNYADTLISTYPEIYAQKGRICNINAMGIDVNFNISIDNLEDAILKAKQTDTYLVLYAHKINNSGEEYTVTPQYLEELFLMIKKHNISAMNCRITTVCN